MTVGKISDTAIRSCFIEQVLYFAGNFSAAYLHRGTDYIGDVSDVVGTIYKNLYIGNTVTDLRFSTI